MDNEQDDFLTDPALSITTIEDVAIVVPETLNVVLYYLVLTYEPENGYSRNEEPTKLRNTSGFQTEIEARAYIIREMRTDRYPRKYVLHIVSKTDVIDIQSTSGN